jgi:U3 small nucleolar RNA-associated protein 22
MMKNQGLLGIDMIVQMPKSMFQEKDYMNMRYFYRRAFFLANIAAGMRKDMATAFEFSFENMNGNGLLPVLVMQPKARAQLSNSKGKASKETGSHVDKQPSDGASEFAIRIIPCAPDGLFPKSKLLASNNAYRLGRGDDGKESVSPTPFYNSTLKAEESYTHYLRILTHAKKECAAFTDACILGRLWLKQRGFGGSLSQGGFGHFEWAVLVSLLLQTGGRNGQAALSSSLSSTELFKAVIQFLANTDYMKKPHVLGSLNSGLDSIQEPSPVLYDAARELNILFKMSNWSANLLRMHARTTLELLNDNGANQFEPIFIINTTMPLPMFDLTFEVKGSAFILPALMDRKGYSWDCSSKLYNTLKRALGDRALMVHVQQQEQSTWPLGATRPAEKDFILLVGVIFDAANMSRTMEYGPPAEQQKEAAKFRAFWGERSELRRFKDGSILECVAWSKRSAYDICEEIISYVAKLHLKITPDELVFFGQEFSSIIATSHLDKEAFDAARRSFQTLESDIRALEELPLQVRQLAPMAPELRYASIKPPTIGFQQDTIKPMDVVLYFEASSRWPENLMAIQETKIEFLLDLDRRLRAVNEKITTCLGREDVEQGIGNLAYLDIIYETGAAFRLRIHCDLEEILLDRQTKTKTLEQHVRTAAEEALAAFRWRYAQLPLHSQSIATYCTRLPALSPTIRLVKHWFNSHLLAEHISEELVELIVLYSFLQPYPWNVPSSIATGFLRCLLLLSRWDWRDEPLIVDTSELLSLSERSTIHSQLAAWRQRDPNMNRVTLIVATPYDLSGLAYTRSGPSKIVAARMTHLAKAAFNLIKEQGARLKAELLFQPSLREYDVLIHLSSSIIKRTIRESEAVPGTKHSQFKNLDERTGKIPLPVASHPISTLLQQLQRTYEDSLMFFHGSNDSYSIGAIWYPKLPPQNFRAGLPYNFKRSDGGGEDDVVEVNRPAILHEIARIGGDMIKKIELPEQLA